MASLETYLQEMRHARPVAVNETSYYGTLANLFNDIGKTLKPKVRYVSFQLLRGLELLLTKIRA